MNHHADHILFEAHDLGRILIKDMIDDLNFKEVVTGTERPALFRAAVDGVIADLRRVRPVKASKSFRVVDVALRSQTATHQVA